MNGKQNPSKDHHYVPVCYQKNFVGDDNRLATLNLKNVAKGYPTKVKYLYPAQICYIKNYYQITREIRDYYDEFANYDDLFIESDVLRSTENGYPEVLEALTKKGKVTTDQAMLMADFIVQIKFRNPYYIDKVIAKNLSAWTTEFIDEVAADLKIAPKYSHIPDEIKNAHIAHLRQEHRPGPHSSKQFQLTSLINRMFREHESNQRMYTALLSEEWTLFIATGKELFITTDNPGYSMNMENSHNFLFTGEYQFYFPLSPVYCLMFGGKKDMRYLEQRNEKLIDARQVDDDLVKMINGIQLDHASCYAIAYNDGFIKKIKLR